MTPEEQAAFDKIKAELSKLQTANADANARAEAAEAKAAQVAADSEVQIALIAQGITDTDDRDAILARYGRLPDENRPDFGKWFAKAVKSDRIVARIVGDVTTAASAGKGGADDAPPADKADPKGADAAAAGKGAKADAPALPGTPAGKAPPAQAPKGYSPERVTGMDVDELRKNMGDIRKEYGYR
jgi:hypothetical protein